MVCLPRFVVFLLWFWTTAVSYDGDSPSRDRPVAKRQGDFILAQWLSPHAGALEAVEMQQASDSLPLCLPNPNLAGNSVGEEAPVLASPVVYCSQSRTLNRRTADAAGAADNSSRLCSLRMDACLCTRTTRAQWQASSVLLCHLSARGLPTRFLCVFWQARHCLGTLCQVSVLRWSPLRPWLFE
jgi:hypothetical protein